jgi:hypothetical protein
VRACAGVHVNAVVQMHRMLLSRLSTVHAISMERRASAVHLYGLEFEAGVLN